MNEPTIGRMVQHEFSTCEYGDCTRRATRTYGAIPHCDAHALAMSRECRPYTLELRASYADAMARAGAASTTEAAEITAKEEARPTRSLLPVGRKRRPLPAYVPADPPPPPPATPPPPPKPATSILPRLPRLPRLAVVKAPPPPKLPKTPTPKPLTMTERLLTAVQKRGGMTYAEAAEALNVGTHSVVPAAAALRGRGLLHPMITVRGVPGFGRIYLAGQAPEDNGRWRLMHDAQPRQHACRVKGCNNKAQDRGVCAKCTGAMPKDIYEDIALPASKAPKTRRVAYGQTVLAYIHAHPDVRLTSKQVAEALKMDKVSVGSAVADLRKAGLLKPATTLRHNPDYGRLLPTKVKKETQIEGLRAYGRIKDTPELSATKVQDYLRRRGGWVLAREVAQYFGCSLESAGSMLGTLAALNEVQQDSRGFAALPKSTH